MLDSKLPNASNLSLHSELSLEDSSMVQENTEESHSSSDTRRLSMSICPMSTENLSLSMLATADNVELTEDGARLVRDETHLGLKKSRSRIALLLEDEGSSVSKSDKSATMPRRHTTGTASETLRRSNSLMNPVSRSASGSDEKMNGMDTFESTLCIYIHRSICHDFEVAH